MFQPHRLAPALLVASLTLLAAGGARAQAVTGGAPQSPTAVSATNASKAFTYQGVLRNGGAPVNGVVDLEVSLWDAESGGAQLGSTQSITTTASAGLFTVTLNSANEFGASALDGRATWVQVAVRAPAGAGAYTTLTPRQAVTAAPLAATLVPHARVSSIDSYSGNPALTVAAPTGSASNPMALVAEAGAHSSATQSILPTALWADAANGIGVFATTNDGVALRASSYDPVGLAGDFDGDVRIAGKLLMANFASARVLTGTGPLPRTSSSFFTRGGTLLLSFSGSGYTSTAPRAIGMTVSIDGTTIDQTSIFANQSGVHMAFVPKQYVLTGLAVGTHFLTLTALAGTSSDVNDLFNVTLTELPF